MPIKAHQPKAKQSEESHIIAIAVSERACTVYARAVCICNPKYSNTKRRVSKCNES